MGFGLYMWRSYDYTKKAQTTSSGIPLFTMSTKPNNWFADYYFPPVANQDQRVMAINKSGQALIEPEQGWGQWLNSGSGMAFPGGGTFTVTFDFLPSWVSNQLTNPNVNSPTGYGLGPAGLENAMEDFYNKVVETGLGTLVENLYAGVKPKGYTLSDSAKYRYTSAIIANDITITRTGGGRATVEVTFSCPSGYWTYDDNKTIVHFR